MTAGRSGACGESNAVRSRNSIAQHQQWCMQAQLTGQKHDRVFNFAAGPATLPVEVLEEAQEDLLNWKVRRFGYN